VVTEKNPLYWDAEKVTLREVRFFPYDTYTESRAFLGNRLHYTYTLPAELIDRDKHARWLRMEPYYGSYYYRYNINRPPFNNPKVRLALALAIDRKALVESVTRANQEPAYAFTPAGQGRLCSARVLTFDPERARALLAEAGYPGGEGFPGFALLMNTSEAHRAIAEAMQDMWRRHLGITSARIENREWGTFQSNVIKQDYDVARAGWIGDYLDPLTFLDLWRKDNSNNNTGWSNPNYDRLLAEAAVQPTTEARFGKLREAESILLAELPVLPLYWYTRTYWLRPEVKNWNPLLLDHHNYKYVRLEP